MEVKFFATPADFRAWLYENHQQLSEQWIGFYKVKSGIPSMTWSESVDEALCYGWIDGLRKSIDEKSYKIRFTPRRPKSFWSAVNIKKVAALTKLGKMMPAGIEAYKKLDENRANIYSFEQENIVLDKAFEKELRANKKAWAYFQTLPPSAKKATIHWLMSAKREDTKLRRLKTLIESAEEELRIPMLRRNTKK
jgi:uncharacterized protein YdeI (YjbR/CyaY-like superfamily)